MTEDRFGVPNTGFGSILLAVAIAVVGIAVAATIITLGMGPFQVQESVSGDPLTTESWQDTLYPGEKTNHTFSMTNDNSSANYSVKIVLESYTSPDGTTYTDPGQIAYALANEDHGPYINYFGINGTWGFNIDLLNDGVAYYDPLPTNTTHNGTVGLSSAESVRTYGMVSVNMTVYRSNRNRQSQAVQVHGWMNNTCGISNCHASNESVVVHANMSAGSDCQSCHGRSMEDLHMSCTAGCHDGFPIPINDSSEYDHGPDTYMQTSLGNGTGCMDNYYFCGENCHGSQISSSHTYKLTGGYCGKCHPSQENATIRSFHDNLPTDCPACHGKNSEQIHSHYEMEPNNQCNRCHDTPLG